MMKEHAVNLERSAEEFEKLCDKYVDFDRKMIRLKEEHEKTKQDLKCLEDYVYSGQE